MPTSSPSPVGKVGGDGEDSLTASAIVARAVSGSHVVKIDGYSHTKGIGTGKHIDSGTFTVGGHRWYMRYYPNGLTSDDSDWISFYLLCDHTDGSEVKAEFKISLLDQDMQPVPQYSSSRSEICTFSSKATSWGVYKFIKRKNLEESLHLKDDVFSVRCDITLSKQIVTEPIPPPVVVPVPPSDMHQHFGQLLLAGEAADVTFKVGAETFAAHRCILAARSSVFKAELLGPMKEKTSTHIRIDDVEPKVFKALLHFIYTDSLPVMDESDGAATAQHLLVAADRYSMERLKLICEGKLCDHICESTAATTLALAEQHGCGALKKACFKFLMSPGNLKAVMASDGYEHLRSSCPSVIDELVAMLAH